MQKLVESGYLYNYVVHHQMASGRMNFSSYSLRKIFQDQTSGDPENTAGRSVILVGVS